jgi:hypothetical protein
VAEAVEIAVTVRFIGVAVVVVAKFEIHPSALRLDLVIPLRLEPVEQAELQVAPT